MTKEDLATLIRAYGTYKLAKRLGIKHQSVINWLRRGKVPDRRAIAVEEILGVSRHTLCPETFGPYISIPSQCVPRSAGRSHEATE